MSWFTVNLRVNDSGFQQSGTDMSTVELSQNPGRTVNPSYGDSGIASALGQEGSASESATEALRRHMLNTLDTAVSEIENRFTQLMQSSQV